MLLDNGFNPDLRVYKEAQYLVKNNNEVEIICLDKKNQYIDKPIENIDGIKIRRLFCRTEKTTKLIEKNAIVRKLKYVIYFWWLIKFLKQAKKYLKKEEYDVLQCHDIDMVFWACLLFRKKKIVFDMHEYYKDKNSKLANFVVDKMVRLAQNRATWIIHVNDFQLKDVKEKNKSKLVYLPNYPEKFKFENIEHKPAENIRVCYTGIIRHEHELCDLIKAAQGIEGVQVNINGAGPAYDAVYEFAKDYKNVVLTGAYSHSQINTFYKNTDLSYIVYDSSNINNRNALPTKLFESIIAKVPVIVAKNSLMGEFVESNGIGFCIEENGSEDIKKILEEITKNKDILRKKVENISKIANSYSWENIVGNLDVIYK